MKTRVFGKTGTAVSEVGLGCWQLGVDWGDVSEDAARRILDTALDEGISFLDTADVYGDGRSERFIGELAERRSERPFIATKLGRRLGYPDGYTREVFREAVQRSLRNLRAERLELVQLHCIPTPWLSRPEPWQWLEELASEGLIRHFGASVESVEQGLACLEHDGLVSLQVIFNIFRQGPAERLFEAAKSKNVAIIVRLPLASGLLGGHIGKDTRFDDSDHRKYNADGQAFNVGETFAGLGQARGVDAAQAVAACTPAGWTLPQMALRWILDHDAVTVVIPGARTPDQVRGNAAVSELDRLPAQLHDRLRQLYDKEISPHVRGPR